MDAQHFRRMFEVLHNTGMDELVTAGIIEPGNKKSWIRFNDDLTTFVLKLDAERVEKLVALVFERK